MSSFPAHLLSVPPSWRLTRLDRLFTPRRELARPEDEPVTAFIDGRVTLRANRPGQIIKGSGKEIGYKHVEPGDLVISGMNAHLGGLGISDSRGKCTPVYTVLHGTASVEPRFVAYSLWSAAKMGYIDSLVNAVRYNSSDFTPETVKRLYVAEPPLEDQRRIADFLDDQVALLDRAIELRLAQVALLEERFATVQNAAVAPSGARRCRLKDLCQGPGQYGFNVAAGDYVSRDLGLRMIRTTDLHGGRLADDAEGIFVSKPVEEKFLLRTGDVLASRAGTVGRAFLVPGEAAGKTFAGFLVRFRPRIGVDPRYVAYSIQSPRVQAEVQRNAILSTIQNFNAERYGDLPMHSVPSDVQREVSDRLDAENDALQRSRSLLIRSTALLMERKQALTTAAVTGQFDVTTARSVA